MKEQARNRLASGSWSLSPIHCKCIDKSHKFNIKMFVITSCLQDPKIMKTWKLSQDPIAVWCVYCVCVGWLVAVRSCILIELGWIKSIITCIPAPRGGHAIGFTRFKPTDRFRARLLMESHQEAADYINYFKDLFFYKPPSLIECSSNICFILYKLFNWLRFLDKNNCSNRFSNTQRLAGRSA